MDDLYDSTMGNVLAVHVADQSLISLKPARYDSWVRTRNKPWALPKPKMTTTKNPKNVSEHFQDTWENYSSFSSKEKLKTPVVKSYST